MVDYDFYTNTYMGYAISEKAFPALAAQAASNLAYFERRCRVVGGQESRKLAICAMAECLREHNRSANRSAATVGSVSVRYDTKKEPLARKLYQAAAVYLDFYRGVS